MPHRRQAGDLRPEFGEAGLELIGRSVTARSAAGRIASVMASACADVSSASVRERATAWGIEPALICRPEVGEWVAVTCTVRWGVGS